MAQMSFQKRSRSLFVVLFLVGLAFLFQASFAIAQFFADIHAPTETDPLLFSMYVNMLSIGGMISRVAGSIVGCLGTWLLLLYFKLRRIEHEIAQSKGRDPEVDPRTRPPHQNVK